MTDRQRIYKALSNAAWGYFFLYFDFNFGTVSVLPAFVGWKLLLSAAEGLTEERRDLALLRSFGWALLMWSGLDWLASWLGRSVSGHILPLDLLVGAAQLYFHFQFLTDCAAIAEDCGEENLCRRLLRWRTVQTLMITAATVLVHMRPLLGSAGDVVIVVVAVLYIVVCLCIMAALFALRRCFAGAQESGAEESDVQE